MKRSVAIGFAIAILHLSAGCPLQSVVGTWAYYDCDGTLVATVRLESDGSASYESDDGDGTGSWTENGDEVRFEATIDSALSEVLIFTGVVFNRTLIVGTTQSDQPPTERCVVMLR